MASESFICYREKGFWIVDDFVSLIARYLVEAYKISKHKCTWKDNMHNDLLVTSLGGTWNLSLFLDKYLDNNNRVESFIEWIKETKELKVLKGNSILTKELNSYDKFYGIYSEFHEDLDTVILIELLNTIENIVNGRGGLKNSKLLLPYKSK